ncbi:N-6 DNA methylase [Butyrivibrio sp. AE2032]|uniref:N-6 DNA methylase n=1 Tax=Butyrivibrio sp. AE2032 TaxID=1458463 RepID=UPI00054CFD45|nr:N-6 DNA methylase [Butyrivibrio sp. AE2032]
MNKIEDVKNFIWELVDSLRNAMFYRELEYSAVRLVFIKYAVDNCVGASTIGEVQSYARAQKMFSMRDVENGMDYLIPILENIDKAYRLSGVLSNSDIWNAYSNELFGYENNSQRKNTTADNYKRILRLLGTTDLEESTEEKILGPMLVNALIDVIVNNSYRNGYASEHTTKPQLNKLVSEILNVQPDDKFCDFASGVGLSTISIVKDRYTNISLADVNSLAVSTSAMLLIMAGYQNLNIKCEDTLSQVVEGLHGNKVFVDAPWGIKLEKKFEDDYTDGTLAVIHKTINNYMENTDDAIAVITLPSGPLFKSNKQTVELRSHIVNKGMLKAIISLPALKTGTTINMNLMVLTKKKNDKVIFINGAENSAQSAKKYDSYGDLSLPNPLIDKILDALFQNKSIEGFSRCVSYEELSEKEYNFIPTVYITPVVDDDETTLEDINNQLSNLYKKLLGN